MIGCLAWGQSNIERYPWKLWEMSMSKQLSLFLTLWTQKKVYQKSIVFYLLIPPTISPSPLRFEGYNPIRWGPLTRRRCPNSTRKIHSSTSLHSAWQTSSLPPRRVRSLDIRRGGAEPYQWKTLSTTDQICFFGGAMDQDQSHEGKIGWLVRPEWRREIKKESGHGKIRIKHYLTNQK